MHLTFRYQCFEIIFTSPNYLIPNFADALPIIQTHPLLGEKNNPLQTLSNHSTWIYATAISPDGQI